MLEELGGLGRKFGTLPDSAPFGRGVNCQIQVQAAQATYERVCTEGCTIILPLETRWYRIDPDTEGGNMQFVVADPDGYLMRIFSEQGTRNVGTK
jgi:predicted enzyme related to lactoylglutathione lyase